MANKKYDFACNVSEVRLVACRDVVGGVKTIYLITYAADFLSTLAKSSNELTDANSAHTFFKYDLRQGTTGFNANVTGDNATGTTFYEQTLEVVLQKIVKEDIPNLDNIIKGRCQIFVLDNNDNCFLMGAEHGCTVTAGAMSLGTAKGDLSGFTLTFTAQEKENYIVKQTAGEGTAGYPFDAWTSNVPTITAGTTPV